MVSYSSVCPALGLLLALSAFCSAQQAATQNPVAVAEAQNKYSSQVKACYDKDKTKFAGCILQEVRAAQPDIVKGNKELGTPSLQPLKLDPMEFTENSASVKGKSTISNTIVHGADKFDMTAIEFDIPNGVVVLKLTIPELRVNGHYKAEGTLILLPASGEGPFSLNMTGINATAKASLTRHGPSGVKLGKLDIDFDVQDLKIYAAGILGGDSVGEAVNQLINDNWKQLLQEIKPTAVRILSSAIGGIAGASVLDLPAQLFIDAGLKLN